MTNQPAYTKKCAPSRWLESGEDPLINEEDNVIKKRPLASRPVCRVTFEIPATVGVTHASVVDDFNGWDPDVNVMKRLKDGRLTATIPLPSETGYAFRHLADGGHWHIDESADSLVQNPYGGHDSYLSL